MFPGVLLTDHLSNCLLVLLNNLPVGKSLLSAIFMITHDSLLDDESFTTSQEHCKSSLPQTTDQVTDDGFLPHLADFLSAGLKLDLPVTDLHLFRDDLERDVYCGEMKASLKRSKDLRLCTSSLMRVRTACFSASLMQMESRTWLPVFITSQPVDMFFSLHGSSYCWEKKDSISGFNPLHFYKLCFIYTMWVLLVTQ